MSKNGGKKYILERCKRDQYIKAWNYMYKKDKKAFNDNPLFDDINPALNKVPLTTETDNFCTVIYDTTIDCKEDGFEYGMPVGIFSFVVTPRKIIGKQYVVHPDYHRQGLGKALLLENEKSLIDNGFEWYYIGCSICSCNILKSFGFKPYSSDPESDMYKFNIELNPEDEKWKQNYKKYVTDADISVI